MGAALIQARLNPLDFGASIQRIFRAALAKHKGLNPLDFGASIQRFMLGLAALILRS